jgi:hypothetical protein
VSPQVSKKQARAKVLDAIDLAEYLEERGAETDDDCFPRWQDVRGPSPDPVTAARPCTWAALSCAWAARSREHLSDTAARAAASRCRTCKEPREGLGVMNRSARADAWATGIPDRKVRL